MMSTVRKRPKLGARPERQQYSEVIDLDSDSEDYVFRDQLLDRKRYAGSYNNENVAPALPGVPTMDIVSPRSDSMASSTSSALLDMTGAAVVSTPNTASDEPPSVIDRLLKRKRTRSVPQLSYAKLRYVPLRDKRSVREKVGEVQTPVIVHHAPGNYVYGQYPAPYAAQRKFSFDYGARYPGSDESDETSATSMEETPCDDKDGHYNVVRGAPFCNDRFQIRKLLGQGTFGKVVKAYDRQRKEVVAIKIIKSIPKYREASKIELRVLAMLKKHDPDNVYQCIHLRECFDYRGHVCIVTDMLKISLYDFLEKNKFLAFPGSHIQAIARQLLRSTAFLHDLNLIHTDLKPENILLQDDTYVRRPYKKPHSSKVYQRKILRDPKIYTIDFGSAIFDDEYHSSVVSTRHYRAPEIVLGTGWSFPCDIWSIGCILVELLTGDALFRTHENVQHLAMMQKVIGTPVDLKLVRRCFSRYYYPSGHRRDNRHESEECIADAFSRTTGRLIFPTVSTPRKLVSEVEQLASLPEIVGQKVGLRFNMQMPLRDAMALFKVPRTRRQEYRFWWEFVDLVQHMLTFDPDKRISTMQAMNHRWFDCGIMDDGIVP